MENVREDVKTFYSSPFVYREGLQLVQMNEPRVCDINKFRALQVQNKITEADIAILVSLFTLKVASKHTCIQYIQSTFRTIKKRYDKNFSALIRFGLIDRYCFMYEVDGATKQTPPVYILTEGGHKIAYKLYKDFNHGKKEIHSLFKRQSILLPIPVLERVIFNQFRASFVGSYKEHITEELYDIPVKHKNCNFTINALYRVKSSERIYEFCILVVRSNPDAVASYIALLEGANMEAQKNNGVFRTKTPIFITICEDELMAEEVQRSRMKYPATNKLLCYFTTDVICAGDSILDNLINVSRENNYKTYDYMRFLLD